MIVVVVIPFWVVETSLTTVLDELPPPDPELLPAGCEDEVDELADVDEVAAVDDVDDIDDVDEDELAALDGVAVTAAVEEAIALIDMKTSPEGDRGHGTECAPCSPLQRDRCAKQAHCRQKSSSRRISPANIRNHSARHGLQLLPTCPGTP